MMKYSSYNHIH